MSAFVPSRCAFFKVSPNKRSTCPGLEVRAQRFMDEGTSSNMVDANLRVLSERIEEIKMKERLERCCRCDYGWNYSPGYNYKLKKGLELSQVFDLVYLICGTIGFTCLAGTILLCLVSLFVHSNQL